MDTAAAFDSFTRAVDGWVWGPWMIGLVLAAGIYLTARTRFVQIRCLGRALRYSVGGADSGEGEISAFGSLCTTLAATIGTGNIVGVATAVAAGGPGALLWMLTAALFGMAVKYAEGVLAVRYRVETSPGHYLGGPFMYIERGLGRRWKRLAQFFALSGAAAGLLGIGTMTQINGITSAVSGLIDPDDAHAAFMPGGGGYPTVTVVTGAVVTLLAALVIIGGIGRIAKVSGVIVPFMAGAYILFTAVIIIANIRAVPAAVSLIFRSAFDPSAVGGAISGLMLRNVIQMGVGRGIFSNEAGLGSAPIAAASARTDSPVRQGLVMMTGAFIDTAVVCTMTGLSVVVTGAWDPRVTGEELEGVGITAYAWKVGLPFDEHFSQAVLTVCLLFFAFTTIIGWSCYGERCLEYLSGGSRRAVTVYRCLYIAAVFAGPYLTAESVWNIADIFNGLMAFPNLIALFLLGGIVEKETKRSMDGTRCLRAKS